MSDEKMREEFETWYLAEYYEGDKRCGLEWLSTEPCGGYRYAEPAQEWKVWQASRAALVVTLSPLYYDGHGRWQRVEKVEDASVMSISAVLRSLEMSGIKVSQ